MPWETAISNELASDAQLRVAPLAPAGMDNDQFSGFYERSARSLWAYIERVSGDPALADDIMQESFVRFLCAEQPTDGEVAARKYVFRIATNLLHDHWRRRRLASLEAVPESSLASATSTAQSDSQLILDPALAHLRPRDRQILWLAYAEGYSHNEIAEITGLASASIRLLLFRARRKLAGVLQEGNSTSERSS